MSESTSFDAARQARRITEQAVAWYIEQQEPLTERQRVAFFTWLRASPKHVAEYFAVAQMHGDLKAAAVLEQLSTAELVERAKRDNPVVMFPLMGNAMPGERHAPAAFDRGTRRFFAGMAGIAATVAMIWLGIAHWHTASKRFEQRFADTTSVVHSLKLVDGTLVQLDRNSVIDVHFNEHYRRIDVIRGNALFDIGKDPARPMLVSVGQHVLQDIGTVFDVKRDGPVDTLTVISGHVRVLNAPEASAKGVAISPLTGLAVADVTAGQQIELSASGAGPVHPVKIAQTTAWLPTEIRFEHETVEDVARRFNAYTSKPLVIENEHIAGKRISGVFHANNPQAFVAYLSTLPDVRVIDGADRIRIVAVAHQAVARKDEL